MIELNRNTDSNTYEFTLKADNGHILFHSAPYINEKDALQGISLAKHHVIEEQTFERRTSKNGKFYFHLKTKESEILGTSQLYSSESGMENGIKNVRERLVIAEIKKR